MYEFLDWQVQDVMSRPVCVSARTSLAEVEKILEKRRFNSLPVVDEAERVLGFVTSLDLLKAFCFPDDVILPPYDEIMKQPVSTIMSRDVLTVCPRTPLTRVLDKIVHTRNKSFPVVEGDRVVGVVAREDVMLALRRSDAGKKPGPVTATTSAS